MAHDDLSKNHPRGLNMDAPWDEVLSLLDVNVAWKNIFINLCDKHAPPMTRYEVGPARGYLANLNH